MNEISTKPDLKTKLSEALLILENETKRRIELIQKLVEQSCENIHAKGLNLLHKKSKSDRELTVAEFCQQYGRNLEKVTQTLGVFDNRDLHTGNVLTHSIEGNKKKPPYQTQDADIDIQLENPTNKRKREHNVEVVIESPANSDEKKVPFNEEAHFMNDTSKSKRVKEAYDPGMQKGASSKEMPPNHGPESFFVHFERRDLATVSICLDPDRTGKFKLNAPTDILKRWNELQRSAVRDQIQDLQDQLTRLKDSLS